MVLITWRAVVVVVAVVAVLVVAVLVLVDCGIYSGRLVCNLEDIQQASKQARHTPAAAKYQHQIHFLRPNTHTQEKCRNHLLFTRTRGVQTRGRS